MKPATIRDHVTESDLVDPADWEEFQKPEAVEWIEGPDLVIAEAETIGGWIACERGDSVEALR